MKKLAIIIPVFSLMSFIQLDNNKDAYIMYDSKGKKRIILIY